MIHRQDLQIHLSQLLQADRFRDYGPNGLQVEGREQIKHIVCGVTASLALIEAAIAAGADAILVHHGLFWRGQDGRVTGWMKQRLARLLQADVNLFAYHLPLDAHAELGNNAQLGRIFGWQAEARFGEQDLGFIGSQASPSSLQSMGELIATKLGRTPVLLPGDGRPLKRVAWCTGGAQGYFEAAIAAGADVFVTGEVSEPQAHLAAETGVAFVAAGHHATERYGVQALAQALAMDLGVTQQFIEIENPA